MIIDCISDLHGCKPALHGGDLTGRDTLKELDSFNEWIREQDYKKKVLIAGNHDGLLERGVFDPTNPRDGTVFLNPSVDYLCDSQTEFEGLKIWGSPWTPEFYNWHFMKKRGAELKEIWDKIPYDTDILITHGPPYGVLDKVNLSSRGDKFKNAGCEELRLALERVKPKLHVFGHIHSDGGKQVLFKHQGPNTICVNAAIMDEDYNPVNKPVRIVL